MIVPQRMAGCVQDLSDDRVLAWSVEAGLIWSAPSGAIERACRLIAEGKLVEPDDIPPQWRAYLTYLRQVTEHV